jgi:hypothetical protein
MNITKDSKNQTIRMEEPEEQEEQETPETSKK